MLESARTPFSLLVFACQPRYGTHFDDIYVYNMCILCGSSGLEAYLSRRIFANSLQLCRIDHVNHFSSSSDDIESDRVQLQKNIQRES
jgi:hypothetical protein